MKDKKGNQFSKLNLILIILLIIGLIIKVVLVKNIVLGGEAVSSIVLLVGILILVVHVLLIWGVYKKSLWAYILAVVFAGHYFRDFDFMLDWYYPVVDSALNWYNLVDILNAAIIVISLVQFFRCIKVKKTAGKSEQ